MSFGFNTALTALTAARVALQTIGHNIANANTEGYSRQRVLLSAYLPQTLRQGMSIGSGVAVSAIDQITDPLIAGRIRAQAQEVGRASGQVDVYRDLEAALGEPSASGFNQRLSDFFASIGQLATSPSDGTTRTAALQSAVTLAQTIRSTAADLGTVAQTVDQAIAFETNRVNTIAQELFDLNRAIVQNGFAGSLPPDIRDRQNLLIAKLAESVDVRATQEPNGQITVTSAGQVLVTPNGVREIDVLPKQITGGVIKLRSAAATADFVPKSGRLSALLGIAPKVAADGAAAFDDLAKNLIRAVNHAHATGIPPSGGYTNVVGVHSFRDVDLDGNILNERLVDGGLPFELTNGQLTISVRDPAGVTRQHRITVAPDQDTVGGFVASIDGIDHISAGLDARGRLRITADAGYQFDFSSRLNPTPDQLGVFGGARPTIVAGLTFPVQIVPGSQFQIAVDGAAPQTVTFLASHFSNPATATAAELAAAINAQVTGATASVAGGRLVVQGNTAGPGGSLSLNGGPPILGQTTGVTVAVSGAYTGAVDEQFTVKPLSDGVIGQTPGLQAEIRRSDGSLVGTIDIGLGYAAGDSIVVADGIEVTLGSGSVSATAAQFFTIDAIAESDSAGVLVATGVNALFEGTDASTIAVRPELLDDPSLLATTLGGGVSDSRNVARLLAVKDEAIPGLGDRTLAERYDLLVHDTGSGAQRAQSTLETQRLLFDQLEARRQSVSGVNIDEELLLMESFQRSFEVAARFTQTLTEVNAVLMDLVR